MLQRAQLGDLSAAAAVAAKEGETLPWLFPMELGLPSNLWPPTNTLLPPAHTWKKLWVHEEEDLLAIAGAMIQGLLKYDVLDEDASMELSWNEKVVIVAADNAKKLGYVQALKQFNTAKYDELVAEGQALGPERKRIVVRKPVGY